MTTSAPASSASHTGCVLFYGPLGVDPADVGLGYAEILGQTAVYLGGGPANQVWFPYRDPKGSAPLPAALGKDARAYFLIQGGVVEKEPYSVARGDIRGSPSRPYPGGSSAPVLILSDSQRAELIAAINDPPQLVDMRHAGGRTAFMYSPSTLADPSGTTLRVLISEAAGDVERGYQPWQVALQRYKTWLDVHDPVPSYPAWMQSDEGFLNVQLQNFTTAALAQSTVTDAWSRWKDYFGRVQFWGQMSNYAGMRKDLADPPLARGELTGCCLENPVMHLRYRRWLPNLVASADDTPPPGRKYHAGYYTRPLDDGPVDSPGGAAYVTDWLKRNADQYGASAFYIDIIGNSWKHGSPQGVKSFLASVPASTVIEHWVDVYPRAPLLSGYLTKSGWPGGPAVQPSTCDSCSFVSLSRFLMGRRIGYLGESDGESVYFGPSVLGHENPFPYWLERQIFLLGTKSEIIHPDLDSAGAKYPYLLRIKELHDRTGWWKLNPRYPDTVGLTGVPSGIEARRFAVSSRLDLVAVDNPAGLSGQFLRLRGRALAIPSTLLSVIKVDRETRTKTVYAAT